MIDQEKVGKFIKEKRKEKNMTQEELANEIGVLAKTVSKWECGKGLPDITIIPFLAASLGVNINQLLLGEDIDNNEDKIKSIMLDVYLEEKINNKRKMISEVLLGIPFIIFFFGSIILGSLLDIETYLRIIIIVSSFILFIIGIFGLCLLDSQIGYYECPTCKHRFVPSFFHFVIAPHTILKRRLKCPNCHNKHYCKKKMGKVD